MLKESGFEELHPENADLRTEREILRTAAAINPKPGVPEEHVLKRALRNRGSQLCLQVDEHDRSRQSSLQLPPQRIWAGVC